MLGLGKGKQFVAEESFPIMLLRKENPHGNLTISLAILSYWLYFYTSRKELLTQSSHRSDTIFLHTNTHKYSRCFWKLESEKIMGWLLLLLYHMYDSHSREGPKNQKRSKKKKPCEIKSWFFLVWKKIPLNWFILFHEFFNAWTF